MNEHIPYHGRGRSLRQEDVLASSGQELCLSSAHLCSPSCSTLPGTEAFKKYFFVE